MKLRSSDLQTDSDLDIGVGDACFFNNAMFNRSVTFLVSKPKCQSQECDIFGFETKMSFSD